ncbi:MAG: peptidylprolyl isomerase [Terrimicrobiaceae bacterium]
MEAIDDQVVRFTSTFSAGVDPIVLDMALFSNRTPITRQNFLNYVNTGRYLNSIIHRSALNLDQSSFVIQGGGIFLDNINLDQTKTPPVYTYVPTYISTDPPIVNEFGISNTLGTISMAKSDGDPNSATSQWFVSLGANSDNLDSQNGGFTTFGRITKSTLGNAQVFGNSDVFPIHNFAAPFNQLPLFTSYVPTSPQPDIFDFILFTNVSLVSLPAGQAGEDPTLSYTVVSNSNPTVATAAIQSGLLSISPVAGQTGTTVVTVRVTDSVGNTVDDSFSVVVNLTDTFTTWASRNSFSSEQSAAAQDPDGDSWNNLQEFAFLGNPSATDTTSQTVLSGTVGTAPAARYMTLTFPVRKSTQGLTYVVEANDTLSGTWTEIWNSGNGFSHAQVVSAVDQSDRTVVTIKDTAAIGSLTKRFLRTRVVQQ